MHHTYSALSVPTPQTPYRRWGTAADWQPLNGVSYRGMPVFVHGLDGSLAYEADGTQLVELPEEAEAAIVDVLEFDYLVSILPTEALDGLKQLKQGEQLDEKAEAHRPVDRAAAAGAPPKPAATDAPAAAGSGRPAGPAAATGGP